MAKRVILSVTNDVFADRRVHKMAMKLHSLGCEVTIIGRRSRQKIEKVSYAKIIRLRMLFKKKFCFYAEYNIRLFFFLLFRKVDILMPNDLDTLAANSLVAKIRSKKLIYDSHELFLESPEIVNRKSIKRFWSWVERVFIKNIYIGITVSPPILKHYKERYNKEFILIRNLPFLDEKPDRDIEMPSYFNHSNIVLYQGSLNVGRGLETAIEAFSLIDNAILILIGSGDIETELRELVKEQKLENKVFFTGRIPQDELVSYTYKAKLGLSIEEKLGKNYEYALPNKLFAYIHASVPVIVSDLPEMRKIVEHYKVGEVFKPELLTEKETLKNNKVSDISNISHKSVVLAQLISSMLDSPSKIEEYKNNCKSVATELCWEKETEILDTLIYQ